MTDLELLNKRFDEWEFPKLDESAKVEYLKKFFLPAMTQVIDSEDMIAVIHCEQSVEESLREVLKTAEYVGDLKDRILSAYGEEGLEARNEELRRSLERVQFKVDKAVNMIVPDMETLSNIPDEAFFIRVMTVKGLEEQSLKNWDMSIGLSKELAKINISTDLSTLKTIFTLLKAIELISSKPQIATPNLGIKI